MNKAEMIESIETLIKANKDNDNCSIYWLAYMIKEVIEEVSDDKRRSR
jgi:hypothetical protein|tara:strand:- start:325 stop:468 length:144 start_codon:yes stop_codon:yes gene_type:complete